MSYKNIIEYQGKPAFVVIPFDEYQELLKLKQYNLTDQQLYEETINKAEEYFPEELVDKIFNGQNSVKTYREYRNFTQEQLAKKIGKTKQYVSALENSERKGTVDTLKKIALALNIDLDMLV